MAQALALKYRPRTFEDLTEQTAVVRILTNQIKTNTIKNGYLFVGAAGTGKTTSARIFASMINKGAGEPIELDAASNNSVDDIRRITEEAQTKSLDSEYKVFIIDECHMLSNSAWNAFLKTLEEPPIKSIFILCTTNPEKIPATILSRVQRYNFQRISMQGVIERLHYILFRENEEALECGCDGAFTYEDNAIDLIAKIADGGMRDAITLLDKCLSYTSDLTVDSVIKALGAADYYMLNQLVSVVTDKDIKSVINIINEVYSSGMDLKQFIKDLFEFVLDLNTYNILGTTDYIKTPEEYLKELPKSDDLLEFVNNLMNEIKWVQNPKSVIIARFMLFINKED